MELDPAGPDDTTAWLFNAYTYHNNLVHEVVGIEGTDGKGIGGPTPDGEIHLDEASDGTRGWTTGVLPDFSTGRGDATIIEDGPAPLEVRNPARPGFVLRNLWRTTESPVMAAAQTKKL